MVLVPYLFNDRLIWMSYEPVAKVNQTMLVEAHLDCDQSFLQCDILFMIPHQLALLLC